MKHKAYLAGGCFWCLEALFRRIKGVEEVISGYTGGKLVDPTYAQVCEGNTGHAEAVEILFDDEIISFETILDIFWGIHDPTTLNRQGNDVGTQYRSEIFVANVDQRKAANKSLEKVNKELFDNKIVTKISSLEKFYPAEAYHQRYFDHNPQQGYCNFVIAPKISEFRKKFSHLLK